MSFIQPNSINTSLLVLCLCAAWCDTCEVYRQTMTKVAAKFPAVKFAWLDIEDYEELLDDYDIETFPTLLIWQTNSQLMVKQQFFFGSVMPHQATLEKLITNSLKQLTASQANNFTTSKLELPTLASYLSAHGMAEFSLKP